MYLETFACHIPPERVSIEALVARGALTKIQGRIMQSYYGIRSTARATTMPLLELLDASLSSIMLETSVQPDEVTHLIHCRTMLHPWPAGQAPLEELCRKHGLTKAISVSMSMGHCASALLALELAKRLSMVNPNAKIITLTGEKCFQPINECLPWALMGEATSAAILTQFGIRHALLSTHSSTLSEFWMEPDLMPRALARQYEQRFNSQFAATIETAIQRAGLTMDQIECVIPHNINLPTLKELERRLPKLKIDCFRDTITALGHSYCSDVFINLKLAIEEAVLKEGDHYVLASAGLGATFVAAVFRF